MIYSNLEHECVETQSVRFETETPSGKSITRLGLIIGKCPAQTRLDDALAVANTGLRVEGSPKQVEESDRLIIRTGRLRRFGEEVLVIYHEEGSRQDGTDKIISRNN